MNEQDNPTLEYAPAKPRRGMWAWILRRLGRLNRPMSLGMIYVLMFCLTIIGTIIAVAVGLVVRALR